MNKLEIGMYVRTKQGKIYKIINNDYLQSTIFRQTNEEIDEPYKVLKASHNVIDLIEVGDYVNGYEVTSKDQFLGFGNHDWYMTNDEIKSIVTKEMFADAEYRVETN